MSSYCLIIVHAQENLFFNLKLWKMGYKTVKYLMVPKVAVTFSFIVCITLITSICVKLWYELDYDK